MPDTKTTAMTEYRGDMFTSSEYDDVSEKSPKLQSLRGESESSPFGLFISEVDLAKVGYKYDHSELIEYRYSSGSAESGIIVKSPRMLVAQKTTLMVIEKVEVDGKTRSNYHQYDGLLHGDRTIYKPCTGYDILFVDADNNLLHETPLQYVAKSSNGASFNAELNKFYDEMVTLHAKLNKVPKRNKDWRFKSLCVFEPTLARVLTGDKTKSYACKYVGYKSPTANTFKTSFIGIDYDKAQDVWAVLNPITAKEFTVIGQLNGSIEESALAVTRQDEVYLAQFLGEFNKLYGNDRAQVESYCQSKYGVSLERMSNNQLLNATDVLTSDNF